MSATPFGVRGWSPPSSFFWDLSYCGGKRLRLLVARSSRVKDPLRGSLRLRLRRFPSSLRSNHKKPSECDFDAGCHASLRSRKEPGVPRHSRVGSASNSVPSRSADNVHPGPSVSKPVHSGVVGKTAIPARKNNSMKTLPRIADSQFLLWSQTRCNLKQ